MCPRGPAEPAPPGRRRPGARQCPAALRHAPHGTPEAPRGCEGCSRLPQHPPGPLSACSTPMNTLGRPGTLGSPKPLGAQNPWEPLSHSRRAPGLQGSDPAQLSPPWPSTATTRLQEAAGSSAALRKNQKKMKNQNHSLPWMIQWEWQGTWAAAWRLTWVRCRGFVRHLLCFQHRSNDSLCLGTEESRGDRQGDGSGFEVTVKDGGAPSHCCCTC